MNPELAAYQDAIKRVRDEITALRAERDTAVAEQHRLFSGMVTAGRELDAANERIAELERSLERLRRLVRVALARGFIHQELREEIER